MDVAFIDPQTGLFYVVAIEGCGIATKSTEQFRPGGFQYRATGDVLVQDESWKVYVRALDMPTGKLVWEQERIGNTLLGRWRNVHGRRIVVFR